MKHKGSVSQVYIERDNVVLPQLFRQAKILTGTPFTFNDLYVMAANMPTKRFYISDDAAYFYVLKRYYKNVEQTFNNPYKHRLFNALYDEVMKMMKEDKYKAIGLKSTTILALAHPAPCVGLTPLAIRNRISKTRCKKK